MLGGSRYVFAGLLVPSDTSLEMLYRPAPEQRVRASPIRHNFQTLHAIYPLRPLPADISSRRLLNLLSGPLWDSFRAKTILRRDRSLREKDPPDI